MICGTLLCLSTWARSDIFGAMPREGNTYCLTEEVNDGGQWVQSRLQEFLSKELDVFLASPEDAAVTNSYGHAADGYYARVIVENANAGSAVLWEFANSGGFIIQSKMKRTTHNKYISVENDASYRGMFFKSVKLSAIVIAVADKARIAHDVAHDAAILQELLSENWVVKAKDNEITLTSKFEVFILGLVSRNDVAPEFSDKTPRKKLLEETQPEKYVICLRYEKTMPPEDYARKRQERQKAAMNTGSKTKDEATAWAERFESLKLPRYRDMYDRGIALLIGVGDTRGFVAATYNLKTDGISIMDPQDYDWHAADLQIMERSQVINTPVASQAFRVIDEIWVHDAEVRQFIATHQER
jgi:hypothetical protein